MSREEQDGQIPQPRRLQVGEQPLDSLGEALQADGLAGRNENQRGEQNQSQLPGRQKLGAGQPEGERNIQAGASFRVKGRVSTRL